jgi:hypothetical protein
VPRLKSITPQIITSSRQQSSGKKLAPGPEHLITVRHNPENLYA